jgi:hypothetical protein
MKTRGTGKKNEGQMEKYFFWHVSWLCLFDCSNRSTGGRSGLGRFTFSRRASDQGFLFPKVRAIQTQKW